MTKFNPSPKTPGLQPTIHYLSNLTPLRGIAAMWVAIFHFNGVILPFVPPNTTQLVAKGYLMVDLFFMMSGFILYHVYHQHFQPVISYRNFRNFFGARFARIYPLHFFTLSLIIVITALIHGWGPIYDPKAIPTNLLLLHSFGIHKIFTWNIPSWSISAEWAAYTVFPLIALFIYRKKKVAMVLMALFAIIAYIAIMFWLPRTDPFDPKTIVPHDLNVSFDYGYLRGLAGFTTGVLLYKLYESGRFRNLFQKDSSALILILLTITGMHFGMNDGFYMILFAAVVLVFALNMNKLHTICNNRFAQYLGNISYSIYLMQIFPALAIWNGLKLPGIVYTADSAKVSHRVAFGYCILDLVILVGLSSLTYYTIEKPCRQWINKKWGEKKIRL